MTVDNSISCVQQDSNVSWGQQIIELLGHNRGIIFAGLRCEGHIERNLPLEPRFHP